MISNGLILTGVVGKSTGDKWSQGCNIILKEWSWYKERTRIILWSSYYKLQKCRFAGYVGGDLRAWHHKSNEWWATQIIIMEDIITHTNQRFVSATFHRRLTMGLANKLWGHISLWPRSRWAKLDTLSASTSSRGLKTVSSAKGQALVHKIAYF